MLSVLNTLITKDVAAAIPLSSNFSRNYISENGIGITLRNRTFLPQSFPRSLTLFPLDRLSFYLLFVQFVYRINLATSVLLLQLLSISFYLFDANISRFCMLLKCPSRPPPNPRVLVVSYPHSVCSWSEANLTEIESRWTLLYIFIYKKDSTPIAIQSYVSLSQHVLTYNVRTFLSFHFFQSYYTPLNVLIICLRVSVPLPGLCKFPTQMRYYYVWNFHKGRGL